MQQTPIFTLTAVLAGAVVAKRFVGFDDLQVSVAGAKPKGVAEYGGVATEAVPVNALGTTIVEAGGAIAVGGPVKSDAAGKAIAQAGAGEIAGYALQAAAADGDLIEILLTP